MATRLDIRPVLARARALKDGQRWSEAVELYATALASEWAERDEREEALIGRAGCRLLLGDRAGAIEDAAARVELKPDDGMAWAWLAGILHMDAKWLPATIAYSKAFELGYDDPAAWGACGEARGGLGEQEAALADLDRAIALAPRFAPAWKSRGLAHARAGDLDRAIADWQRAAALDPKERATCEGWSAEARRTLALPCPATAGPHFEVNLLFVGTEGHGTLEALAALVAALAPARIHSVPEFARGRGAPLDVHAFHLGELRRHPVVLHVLGTDAGPERTRAALEPMDGVVLVDHGAGREEYGEVRRLVVERLSAAGKPADVALTEHPATADVRATVQTLVKQLLVSGRGRIVRPQER